MERTDVNLYPTEAELPRNAAQNAVKEFWENPAFRFFGRRLFSDQTLPEFLNELLLILFSPKRLEGKPGDSIPTCFPPRHMLCPEGQKLQYAPKAQLNLKLFAFWSASRLDARHPVHRQHFECLRTLLRQRVDSDSPQEVNLILRDMENIFLGLRSIGEGRTWCAQQFLPIVQSLLTSECIWEERRGQSVSQWEDALSLFSFNKYAFMARGGEVLYYQLCLALSQKEELIRQWNNEADLGLSGEEASPAKLHAALERHLPRLFSCPGLECLAKFICGLESETAKRTDSNGVEARYQSMHWCARESWREGYLFAVELLRIVSADLDIMDRLSLLESACGMHILRTLAARTAALSESKASWPGYLLPVTAPEEKNASLRAVSHNAYRHLQMMQQRLILDQLPNCTYDKGHSPEEKLERKKKYLEEVSAKYNAGLYAALAKNQLGLVAPRKGQGARFVLPERVLRLLVLTLIPAGQHLSLDTFKRRARAWHGLVFDASGFEDAQRWLSDQDALFSARCGAWLRDMLEDGNFLIHLSDACSLVRNPIRQCPEN